MLKQNDYQSHVSHNCTIQNGFIHKRNNLFTLYERIIPPYELIFEEMSMHQKRKHLCLQNLIFIGFLFRCKNKILWNFYFAKKILLNFYEVSDRYNAKVKIKFNLASWSVNIKKKNTQFRCINTCGVLSYRISLKWSNTAFTFKDWLLQVQLNCAYCNHFVIWWRN